MDDEQTDPFTPDLGCGFNDWVCYGQEGVARLIGQVCKAMGDFIGDMLANSFLGAQAAEGDWAIAGGQFWFWAAVASLLVVGIGFWQIAVAVILQQAGRVLTIVAGMVAGVFLSVMALQWMPSIVRAFSGITSQLTAGLSSDTGIGGAVVNVLGIGEGIDGVGYTIKQTSPVMAIVRAPVSQGLDVIGPMLLAMFALGVISVAALLLFIAMSLRTFGLIALVAFAPLGLMFYGQPRMRDLAEKWAQLALGLLLAEPLAAGLLLLATNIAAGTTSSSMGLLLVSAGAIFAAAFAPLWAVKMVSFAAGEVQTAMGNSQWGQGQSSRAGAQAVRWASGLLNRRRFG